VPTQKGDNFMQSIAGFVYIEQDDETTLSCLKCSNQFEFYNGQNTKTTNGVRVPVCPACNQIGNSEAHPVDIRKATRGK